MSKIKLPSALYSIPRSPILAVGIPLAIAFASGLLTKSAQKWYLSLRKPPGEPKSKLFRYIWLGFYGGMGYSSHLITRALDSSTSSSSPGTKMQEMASIALKLHYFQYSLNLLWSGMFFGGCLIGTSLIISTLLTSTSLASLYCASKVNKKTIFFLTPYTIWIIYSQYLHLGVWYLNSAKRKGKGSRGTRGVKGGKKGKGRKIE